ncbi:neuronal acetylcholine receptor subunit alpha-5 isoform X2 [Cryptotermes secundus]|uniref:neuronal acetylcholine receptor subunit alpha-5 isoform X2 n=1 Tax=Cryptotermes secundus TaxID=105785 RepID=UPI000CD7B7FE|nr:neuronal acetylcholine receptor subunit alpha-5 isoform X2 [Cryptotermes secundus]
MQSVFASCLCVYKQTETHERIDVYYGLYMEWEDERLKWDPSHYGNIKRFYTSESFLWTPQIGWVTMDVVGDRLYMGVLPCLLESSGRVTCISWSSFGTNCRSDLTHWPYDSHVCEALLAPWRLQHEELKLIPVHGDNMIFQFHEPNGEWELQSSEIRGLNEMFENTSFGYLEVTLTLARHSATHEATVVIPVLVLVVLTLASFWIEAEISTRLSLECTLLICHSLYLQYMGLYLFNGGVNCPLIVLFYRDSMLVCGISLVVTFLVRWMARSPAMPPSWASGIAMKVQNSLPGQLLIFLHHPHQVADRDDFETSSEVGPNWRLIGRLLDRMSFLAFTVTYFVLLIVYYLYYL